VQYVRDLDERPEKGYSVAGFADNKWPGLAGFAERGYRPVVELDGVASLVSTRVIDEVVIGLPMKSHYAEVERIIEKCREQGIIVRLLSSLFGSGNGTSNRWNGEARVVTVSPKEGDWVGVVAKRAVDIVLSGILLGCAAPVLLITSFVIKWGSPGPAFFVQERVGLNKRRFRLYKLRTMSADAEVRQKDIEHLNEVDGAAFKVEDDPRITRVGRFLRRSSIDELPQLLNVLKGEMSLVGPRPLPLRDVERFEKDWQRRRFSVRPGLTCLWQINGRSSLSFEEWMKLDLEYIDKWSMGLDLKILAKTIPAVVKGSGAV
jgi:exopolysaccharide biosynthesis polyprenyl glycosylphosphotransferase